jgi:hypothetical protein
MNRYWKRLSAAAGLVVVLLSLLAPQIDAHEKGVLKLTTRRLMPGDSVAITGEHFGRRASLKILLVGTAGRRPLAEIRTDSLGALRWTLTLPADVAPGSYRVVAIAADGDEVASVDVSVVARASAPMSSHVHEESAPTARPLALVRARSPMVTGGALAIIALTLVTGIMLLRRSPAVESTPNAGGQR